MATETNNKIVYGLRNVHVAKQTETIGEDGSVTYAYETPKLIQGAVSMSADPQGEDTPFYADDVVYYRTTANNGYSGDLEFANLPDWFLIEFLGFKKDSKGILYELSDAGEAPKFALLFEFQGDVKAVRHCMYNCAVSRPKLEGNTKEASITPKTGSVSYTCDPRKDGIVKASSTVGGDATAYGAWYSTVPAPAFATE